jgi:hypothetical protein
MVDGEELNWAKSVKSVRKWNQPKQWEIGIENNELMIVEENRMGIKELQHILGESFLFHQWWDDFSHENQLQYWSGGWKMLQQQQMKSFWVALMLSFCFDMKDVITNSWPNLTVSVSYLKLSSSRNSWLMDTTLADCCHNDIISNLRIGKKKILRAT